MGRYCLGQGWQQLMAVEQNISDSTAYVQNIFDPKYYVFNCSQAS
jgi:hypothetical protein